MKNRSVLFLGIFVLLLFFVGILQLFWLRFSSGDIYPYYSSHRSDPLGTKAIYEAFAQCGIPVRRNYEPFSKLKETSNAVVIVPGLAISDVESVPESLVDDLNYFVRNGGRIVLTFLPVQEIKPIEDLSKALEEMQEQAEPTRNLTDEWDFRIGVKGLSPGTSHPVELDLQAPLPEVLSLHTSAYFSSRGKGWTILYSLKDPSGKRPVLIERTFGKGSILLSVDSYFLSNEAMARERHPQLLAWLVGNSSEVVFDEYHFGIASAPGVIALARKYNLEWVGLGLLIITLLYVWKSAVPLVTSAEEKEGAYRATGKESAVGLTHLLRRNIPPSKVLSVSFEQWKKTSKLRNQTITTSIDSMVQSKDPVGAYNSISQMLRDKNIRTD